MKADFWIMLFLVISGILWGSLGLFNFDILESIMVPEVVQRIIYFVFGICGIYALVNWKHFKKIQ